MDMGATMASYLELGEVASEIRNTLAFRLVAPAAGLPEGIQQAFQRALLHLGQVREGFAVSVRASDFTDIAEMRDIVKAFLFDWESMGRLFDLSLSPDDRIEMPTQQLMAYAHSYVTMGVLPSLPAEAVTYPQRHRTYADIHAPRSPGEVLERIEEMEEVVSEVEVNSIERIDSSRLRRTYGFFEASAWLVAYHAARFKKKKG